MAQGEPPTRPQGPGGRLEAGRRCTRTVNKQFGPVISGSQIIVPVTKLILDLIPLFAGMITAAETPLPVSQISVLQQKSSYLIYPLEDKFQSPIKLVSSVNRVSLTWIVQFLKTINIYSLYKY